LQRFFIAFIAAFLLVTACSLSMQPHTFKNLAHVGAVCSGVLVFAIPCSGISALVFRRSELALVSASQVLTVAALALCFGVWA
jgi:membrane protein DedA with SNARE-associated domain